MNVLTDNASLGTHLPLGSTNLAFNAGRRDCASSLIVRSATVVNSSMLRRPFNSDA